MRRSGPTPRWYEATARSRRPSARSACSSLRTVARSCTAGRIRRVESWVRPQCPPSPTTCGRPELSTKIIPSSSAGEMPLPRVARTASRRHDETRAAVATTPPGLERKSPRPKDLAASDPMPAEAAGTAASARQRTSRRRRTTRQGSRGQADPRPSKGLLDVDLRALELARVVDVDRLPLGEDVERRLAGLTVAVARVLRAAEGQVHLGADRPGVHVRDPGLEVAHRPERVVDVAREDRGREPILDPVRDADRLVDVAHLHERGRRAEDLLLRDAHPRVDASVDRRPVEVAASKIAVGRNLAAGEELRALAGADLRVRVDLLERGLVDHRADVGAFLPARAEPQLLDPRDELLLQRVVDFLVCDHARRRGAALAGRPERRPDDAVDGEVEVGVVHDDDRVLAAELEMDVLVRLRAGFEHLHTRLP